MLDNARYQRCAVVYTLAQHLNVKFLYLLSCSPNMNLIERLGKSIECRALAGRSHPTFAEIEPAVRKIIDGLPTYSENPKSLMSLNLQRFENVLQLAV